MNQKRTCGIVTLVIMSLFSVIEAAAEDTNIEYGNGLSASTTTKVQNG